MCACVCACVCLQASIRVCIHICLWWTVPSDMRERPSSSILACTSAYTSMRLLACKYGYLCNQSKKNTHKTLMHSWARAHTQKHTSPHTHMYATPQCMGMRARMCTHVLTHTHMCMCGLIHACIHAYSYQPHHSYKHPQT